MRLNHLVTNFSCSLLLFVLSALLPSTGHSQNTGISAPQKGEQDKTAAALEKLSNADSSEVQSVPATELKKVDEDLMIQWQAPEFTASENQGMKGIRLKGTGKRRTIVSVLSNYYIRFDDKVKPEKLLLSRANIPQPRVVINKDGKFEIEMFFQKGSYQLAFKTYKEGKSKEFVAQHLSFVISDTEIKSPAELPKDLDVEKLKSGLEEPVALKEDEKPLSTESIFFEFDHEVNLGIGLNLITYSKSLPSVPIDAAYSIVKGPSLFTEYKYNKNKDFMFMGSYRYSPGSVSSGENILVSSSNYSWQTVALETLIKKYPVQLLQSPHTQLYSRVGLQTHMIPHLQSNQVGVGTADLNSAMLTTLSLGAQVITRIYQDYLVEIFLRYQYPVIPPPKLKIKSSFIFDGSIGIHRQFDNNKFTLGVYWYGQSHSYQTSEYDTYSQTQAAGRYDLFFSNFEIRGGYHF